MSLPKKIKCGLKTYKVLEGYSDEYPEAWGSIDYKGQRIWIEPFSEINDQKETFIHEILHAIMFKAGINYLLAEKERETVVDSLSKGLVELTKNNPSILEYLKE